MGLGVKLGILPLLVCSIYLVAQEPQVEDSVVYPPVVTDPLAAMVGKWISTEAGDCETRWVKYSLSEDRTTQILEYSNGRVAHASILEVLPGRFHLQYEPESRTTEDGTLVTWWLIYVDVGRYKMRRDDWGIGSRTAGSWDRCSEV